MNSNTFGANYRCCDHQKRQQDLQQVLLTAGPRRLPPDAPANTVDPRQRARAAPPGGLHAAQQPGRQRPRPPRGRAPPLALDNHCYNNAQLSATP
eukprot:scaffold41974_cov36-Prasinocladus_malaysianus.AAC.1